MSTSIHGIVEAKLSNSGFDDWHSLIDCSPIIVENYDLFGCLFGVMNFANFKPLFPDRGLPSNCSQEFIDKYRSVDYHKHPTWCTYQELTEIDTGEKALAPDERVNREIGGMIVKALPENEAQRVGSETMTRSDALDVPGYKLLLELMKVLSIEYGDDNVRWIVFFD